ncbi:conserved hypothetical protein, partial [Ixodes scapularis]
YKTAYACEGSQLSFACPEGQLISLIRANYGRFSISICNEHGTLDWSVDCKSNRSYNVIRESCGMQRQCSLPASTALFGDPCPGTFKYLEAHYQCIAGTGPMPERSCPCRSPTTTSSTTPFSTSTTSTTARPHIIIPATQYQRPPAPLMPTSPPSPAVPSTTRNTFGDRRIPSSSTTMSVTPMTSTTTSAPPVVERSSARPQGPGQSFDRDRHHNGSHKDQKRPETATETERRKAVPKSGTMSEDEEASSTTVGGDGWGGRFGAVSSTDRPIPNDVPPLGRGKTLIIFCFAVINSPVTSGVKIASLSLLRLLLSTGRVPAFKLQDFCPPMQSRNSFWNWTRAGDVAVQRCPNGAIGMGRPCLQLRVDHCEEIPCFITNSVCNTIGSQWNCAPGNPPSWESDVPDLSACYSVWMENLKSRTEDGDSVVSLAVELEVITRTKSLLGGDILQTAGVVQRLLGRMTRKLEDIPDERQRYQVVKELLQSTVEVSSNLLEDYQRDSWMELPPRERRRVAGALLEALDNSTWLLADTRNAAFTFSRAHGNVCDDQTLLEAFCLYTRGAVVLGMWGVPARFWRPRHSEENSKSGSGRVVCATSLGERVGKRKFYFPFSGGRRGEDFLGPELLSSSEASSSDRIINSRVIAASVNSHHMLKLHQPVLITFQHREVENVTNPRCVFWSFDAEDWLTEGCWLKETNESHTLCACNHLTNFALAMDRRPPKVSGSSLSASEQKLQLVVYASFATCMVLLIATGLTLQAFRSLKGERVTIHKNLCFCLLLTEALLASGLGGHPHRVVCGVLAGFLHYFWLASFFWVLLGGF